MCVLFVSGCGHSGGFALPPDGGLGPIAVSIATSGSTISLVIGATATVTVSEGNYGGPFSGTSSNPSVATVTPATAASTIQGIRRPLETGVAVFQVTAIAAGTTSVFFADQGGHGVAATVRVFAAATPTPAATATPIASSTPAPTATPPGVQLTPSTLSFENVGAGFAQTVSASETNFAGSFVASGTSCNGIATIFQIGPSSFSVTPVSAGICTFTITGGNGQFATLGVTVTVTNVGGT